MALIVEDGTGKPDAESYVSVSDLTSYAARFGKDLGSSDQTALEQALRRATAYIDNTFRNRFTGLRTFHRNQALEWPRIGAFYSVPQNPIAYIDAINWQVYVDPILNNVVPPEVINATCEAAAREAASPFSLLPDLDRGGAVKMLKAGSVMIQYADGASPTTVFQEIGAAMSALLMPSNRLAGRATRG